VSAAGGIAEKLAALLSGLELDHELGDSNQIGSGNDLET
jgi:hypothetical protein